MLEDAGNAAMKLTSYGLDTSEPGYGGHGTQMSPRHPGPLRTSWFLPLVGAYCRLKDKLA